MSFTLSRSFKFSGALSAVAHRGFATGTVKWFNRTKGFGFIVDDADSRDVFVHHTSINSNGYRFLNEGERVQFEHSGEGDRRAATNVVGEDGNPLPRGEFGDNTGGAGGANNMGSAGGANNMGSAGSASNMGGAGGANNMGGAGGADDMDDAGGADDMDDAGEFDGAQQNY